MFFLIFLYQKVNQDIESLKPFYVSYLIIGLIFIIIGRIITRNEKNELLWLQRFLLFQVLGFSFTIIGLFIGIYIVSIVDTSQLGTLHLFLGLMTIIILSLWIALGPISINVEKHTKKIKMLYEWAGRISIVLTVITMVFGFRIISIIY